jgi:hypothetical protein
MYTRTLGLGVLVTLLSAPYGGTSAAAQAAAAVPAGEQREAKHYFEAGAAAYAMGDYRAAIQAFAAAYALTPLPAIAFSLAQAERRQYFVSHEPPHLLRAIELFRAYLAAVGTGGRRADATDALAQLEPLALAVQQSGTASPTATSDAERTRLLVRCEAKGARISLDGGAQQPSPLIVETAAGPHRVRVEAPGYFPSEQQVTAVSGELVPIEVTLQERPAVVLVQGDHGAEVFVDGERADLAGDGRLELRAGRHQLAFAKKGHSLQTRTLQLERGQTRRLQPRLSWTGQRVAAISLFAIGGGTLITGLSFAGIALDREHAAKQLDSRRDTTTLSPNERESYEDAVEDRNRARVAAIVGLTAAAGCLLTGFLLYQLDDPSPLEAAARARERSDSVEIGLTAVPTGKHGELGVQVRGQL